MGTSLGIAINNPGNLEVPSSNPYLYAGYGQTSVYNSPNGASYAGFPSVSSGLSALAGWLGDNVGTDPSTSLSTPSQLVGYYLNGNYNGVSPTSANPYPQTYLNIIDQATGMTSNQQFTQAQLSSPSFMNSLMSGIEKAEGTSSLGLGGGVTSVANTSSTNPVASGAGNLLTEGLQMLGLSPANAQAVVNGAAGGAAGAAVAPAATSATGIISGIEAWVNGLITGFESGIEGTLARGGFIAVGLILLIAGIVFVVASNKTVQQVVATGVKAAA